MVPRWPVACSIGWLTVALGCGRSEIALCEADLDCGACRRCVDGTCRAACGEGESCHEGACRPAQPCVWSALSTPAPLFDPGRTAWLGSVTPDGLAMYFSYFEPATLGDLQVTTRASPDLPFADPPTALSGVNTADDEGGAALSSDALTLYFASDRPGSLLAGDGDEGLDLWMATRAETSAAFGEARALPNLNVAGRDMAPHLSGDGRYLYFASNRPEGQGGLDIYRAERAGDGSYGDPVPLAELNSSSDERGVWISTDGLEAFVASDRPGSGTSGGFDLWSASRRSRDLPFDAPVPVAAVNSVDDDVHPCLSADGATLYLNHRAHLSGGNPPSVIWQARRSCLP